MKQGTINLGKWTETDIDNLLALAQKLPGPGGRIGFISKQFLGTHYSAFTLPVHDSEREDLVVNLSAVDCFTFLDYLEAMRRSASYKEFLAVLRDVRYRNGIIAYRKRNHFFSDWPLYQPNHIVDITASIAGEARHTVEKYLNLREDGSLWVKDVAVCVREITYIPTECIDDSILSGLRTGDYIGIYCSQAGLDVSHVGVIIKGPFITYLRHASSAIDRMKVTDDDLIGYVKTKPGIVVYRPK